MLYHPFVLKTFRSYVKQQNFNQFNFVKRFDNFGHLIKVLEFTNNVIIIHRLFACKMSGELNVFNGTVDRYNGITVDTETEPIDDKFSDKLKCM